MKNRVKKPLSLLLAVVMMLCVVPMRGGAAAYNVTAAVNFANAHWNDGIGLCAEFVSRCLNAGGISIPNYSYYSSGTKSYENNSGTLGSYTNPYTCSASLLLYLSEKYKIISNPSNYDIDVGDVVFMYSMSNGQLRWRDGHVGLCVKKVNGAPKYAAHNKAQSAGGFSSSYPCTYVAKISSSSQTHTVNLSYGKNFTSYPKSKITAANIFDANHNQISSTAWIGTSDKCTIHEVYTDGCCKVSYPLDSGGTKTVYSKISLFNTHKHSYSANYESAHPHKEYMKCNCGDWYYTGNTNYVVSCNSCKNTVPSKPVLNNIKSEYKENSTIKFEWNPTKRTTHYSLYLKKLNDKTGKYDVYDYEMHYVESGYEKKLPVGKYKIQLQSSNSETWDYTDGDWIDFSVVHAYNSGKITTAATCKSTGVKTYTCTVCKTTKTEIVAKNPSNHAGGTAVKNSKAATCTTKGYTGDIYCLGCGVTTSKGREISAKGHRYDSGKITTTATCKSTGIKTYTCTDCKTTKTETVAKLNHRDSNGDGKCDMCGFKVGESGKPDTPDDSSNNCNHICHKSGFKHFLYIIVRMFWRLFKINQVCDCGFKHY